MKNNATNATLATDPNFFAPVLAGYLKTVLRDEAKANTIIAERLKKIEDRCAELPCTTNQRDDCIQGAG
ncbi:hypothetical protein HAQ01_04050 [Acidithiobacillus thiooxidans]|uniref:hypothetical protein n=1 Tax=Acidithiobacillus thiooxidans TaxID=930 RepID=UPI001C06B90C|nr:hypothetical protein [Acidithiobacillus thiooxidans]MBU2792598.1 hypothetical protein [Acidithiobacillus thiooxidans]